MAVLLTDVRSNSREKPVWKAVFDQIAWVNGETGGDLTKTTSTVSVSGEIKQIVITPTEATSGGNTFNVDLYDQDDNKLGDIVAALDDAAGATVYTQADFGVRIGHGFYFIVIANQDPGTAGTTLDITMLGT